LTIKPPTYLSRSPPLNFYEFKKMKREDKKEEKKTNAKIKTRRRSRNASYASWITC